VEQKNGAIIRKFIGYDRFEGMQPYQILSALYEPLRLYVNFFQPSLKLTSKTREGARVIKKYDQARTPSQRLLADDRFLETSKQKLTEQYKGLDPVQLLASIRMHQDQLWEWAYVELEGDDFENRQISQQPRMTRQPFREEPSREDNAPSSRPKLEPAERMYRRTKKPRKDGDGKRGWRTRVDPFADVILEVEEALERTPSLNAKMLFQELQQRHPGKFTDGQLRTFQRRVSTWRVNWINAQSTKKSAHIDPGSVPRKDDLR
jgi:hypothetical protein